MKDETSKRGHKKGDDDDEESENVDPVLVNSYPSMSIQLGDFKLHIKPGNFYTHQITLILGENGTGKSTFIKTIAGARGYTPIFDHEGDKIPSLAISYKPQTLSPNFEGTVQDMLNTKIPATFNSRGF